MGTEYEIHCPDHDVSIPEGGARYWHVSDMHRMIAEAKSWAIFATYDSVQVEVIGWYGYDSLPQFLLDHSDCPMEVRNEYGELTRAERSERG